MRVHTHQDFVDPLEVEIEEIAASRLLYRITGDIYLLLVIISLLLVHRNPIKIRLQVTLNL